MSGCDGNEKDGMRIINSYLQISFGNSWKRRMNGNKNIHKKVIVFSLFFLFERNE